MIIESSREYFSISSFRHRTLKRFVANWATLPRQLWRLEVRKSIAIFFHDLSADWNGILVEKREKFLTAGYVVFIVPVCDTKFV